MLNKPINARTLLIVVVWAAFSYMLISALVNFKLLHELISRPISLETMTTALERVEGCLGPWLASMFATCLIGASCFAGSANGTSASWSYDDDEDFSTNYSWSRSSDDDFRVNPATGFPMIGGYSGGVDAAGHAWGSSD